jgi:hypothetical protein
MVGAYKQIHLSRPEGKFHDLLCGEFALRSKKSMRKEPDSSKWDEAFFGHLKY